MTALACHMPTTIDAEDADVYRNIHAIFCARRLESHECQGAVTLTARSLTLRCKLCGDARKVIEAPIREAMKP